MRSIESLRCVLFCVPSCTLPLQLGWNIYIRKLLGNLLWPQRQTGDTILRKQCHVVYKCQCTNMEWKIRVSALCCWPAQTKHTYTKHASKLHSFYETNIVQCTPHNDIIAQHQLTNNAIIRDAGKRPSQMDTYAVHTIARRGAFVCRT